MFAPVASFKMKSGAVWPSFTVFTVADTRVKSAFFTRRIAKIKHAMAASASVAQIHFLAPSRRSLKRASAWVAFGFHSLSGFSLAMWSSTGKFSFISLPFSISFDVFLSERLLGTTEKSSNGSGIQVESRCHFVVAEAMAAQEKQIGLARFDNGQHQTDFLLVIGGTADVFRSWNLPGKTE